jgi:hypothetical protein
LVKSGWCQTKDGPSAAEFKEPLSQFWLNTYGNIRITDRLFWVAQTHFRFQQTQTVPLVGQIAQVYNRHAVSYLFSKRFTTSLGGVLRMNFNTDDIPVDEHRVVPEWRIWHEYQFSLPLSRLMIYHRIRIEHRWTKSFAENADFFFRNRWRYMLSMKIPVNKPKLGPHAFYVAPESEIIMQSGRSVINSPMEDLRLHVSFGYIINPRLTVATGLMYSFGQELTDGAEYKQKFTWRMHVYFAPDFRKIKNKLPDIHRDE